MQIGDRLRDPLDLDLPAGRHEAPVRRRRERGRGGRTGSDSRASRAQRAARLPSPLLGEHPPAAPAHVDARQGSRPAVERRGHDDHVQRVHRAVGQLDALGNQAVDRRVRQVDEVDVVAAEHLEVAGVQAHGPHAERCLAARARRRGRDRQPRPHRRPHGLARVPGRRPGHPSTPTSSRRRASARARRRRSGCGRPCRGARRTGPGRRPAPASRTPGSRGAGGRRDRSRTTVSRDTRSTIVGTSWTAAAPLPRTPTRCPASSYRPSGQCAVSRTGPAKSPPIRSIVRSGSSPVQATTNRASRVSPRSVRTVQRPRSSSRCRSTTRVPRRMSRRRSSRSATKRSHRCTS